MSLIETEDQRSESAVTTVQREIGFLREYRTRLVADVVTGKLDVRAAARQLPAEAERPAAGFPTGKSTQELEMEDEGAVIDATPATPVE